MLVVIDLLGDDPIECESAVEAVEKEPARLRLLPELALELVPVESEER